MSDQLNNMQIPICEAPCGNGFEVEHMPDFLLNDDFDNLTAHIHSFYEIIWFQEGEGIHVVDFQEYEIKPNTVFFLSPGQVHHFDKKNGYKGYSIKMSPEFLRNQEVDNNIFLEYNAFHTFDTAPFYHLDEQTAQNMQLLVNAMEEESERASLFGNVDILQSLIRIFLVIIQRHGQQDKQKGLDNMKASHLLFIRFRKLVEHEYMHIHTVQEYADLLNVSVRTLNKCVNECSKMSPLAFINKRIILEAKRMARYSNLMIKEIAYKLGYEDPSYFVKLFKRQTGFLPSEFRENDITTIYRKQ